MAGRIKRLSTCSLLIFLLTGLTACGGENFSAARVSQTCEVEIIVLGAGQDAGIPQINTPSDPAWTDPSLQHWATSLALVDHRSAERYLFEATPDITRQIQLLDTLAPTSREPSLAGIFLTHAHIGHYTGLMFLGREAAGTQYVPVYAMPRMKEYLENNGPWSQLVELQNISLRTLQDNVEITLANNLRVVPFSVPHRDEYSETVGYIIHGPGKSVLFLPDIDSWETLEDTSGMRIEDLVSRLDYAFVDATFFDDNELPGRDMSKIPHPRISETMAKFKNSPLSEREKIQFIHYNHTNPIRDPNNEKTKYVKDLGFGIARQGQQYCLDAD